MDATVVPDHKERPFVEMCHHAVIAAVSAFVATNIDAVLVSIDQIHVLIRGAHNRLPASSTFTFYATKCRPIVGHSTIIISAWDAACKTSQHAEEEHFSPGFCSCLDLS